MILRTLCAAAIAAFTLTACGSPCGDLQSQCDSCNGPLAKAACNIVVAADDGDTCQAALNSNAYEANSAACQSPL